VPVWARLFTLAVFFLLVLRLSSIALPRNRAIRLTGVFLFSYLLLIVAARCGFDSAISFDTRILAPAYGLAMISVVSLIAPWARAKVFKSYSPARFVFFGLLIAVSAMQIITGISWWRHSYSDGIGFTESAWRTSELLKFVDTVDASVAIFTNVPDVIYMLRGRGTVMIPRKINPANRLSNDHYQAEIAGMKEDLTRTNGMVVYFFAEQRLWYLPSAHELQRDAGLRLVALKKDGYVYRLEKSK
jgi:hypothetical protein